MKIKSMAAIGVALFLGSCALNAAANVWLGYEVRPERFSLIRLAPDAQGVVSEYVIDHGLTGNDCANESSVALAALTFTSCKREPA